jgi:50S ribosomal protein L16 3-hydroxylase
MNIHQPLELLGGLSPHSFMQGYWQQKPLLVRQAWPGVRPPLTRAQAFAAAGHGDIESRVVLQDDPKGVAGWTLRHGPLSRRALPSARRPRWTLLLQGLDLHVDAAHQMLKRFRFVPDVLLDDVMLSWASEGGGVGPHTDAYDVFLLQVQGQRRWRVGPVPHPEWVKGSPLKRLRRFKPAHDWLLQPGDMLYLPPLWGHDGVAEGGECMTCSIGFRAPSARELALELLQRLGDEETGVENTADDSNSGATGSGRVRPGTQRQALYRHANEGATSAPGALPPQLTAFATAAVQRQLQQPGVLSRALGEWATEPKPRVWFEPGEPWARGQGVELHARTRMMYDDHHVFINGEAFEAAGRDAQLMRQLADARYLPALNAARLGMQACELLAQWAVAGWVVATGEGR